MKTFSFQLKIYDTKNKTAQVFFNTGVQIRTQKKQDKTKKFQDVEIALE